MKVSLLVLIVFLFGIFMGAVTHEIDLLSNQIHKDGIMKPWFSGNYECKSIRDIK